MPRITIGYYVTYKHLGTKGFERSRIKHCINSPHHVIDQHAKLCKMCGSPIDYINFETNPVSQNEIIDQIPKSLLDSGIVICKTLVSYRQTHIFLPMLTDDLTLQIWQPLKPLSEPITENVDRVKFEQLKERLTLIIGRKPDAEGFGCWNHETY